MDITSLPDEMLACVVKYADYSTVTNMRRLNKRINAISKGYGIGCRLPIKVLSCESKDRKWTFNIVAEDNLHTSNNSDELEQKSMFRIRCADYMMPKTMDYILKKIVITDEFSLAVSVWSIDNAFVERLIRNRDTFRCLNTCNITASFGCSTEILQRFIVILAKLDDITICGTRVDRICQSQVFGNRKWNSLNIHSGWYLIPFKHEGLNDRFLHEVAQNCKNLRICCEYEEALQFTIQGILEVFKIVLEHGQEPNWLFQYVQLGCLTMAEAESLFIELPNCSSEFNLKTDDSGRFRCNECKVSANDTGLLLLTVSIYDPQ